MDSISSTSLINIFEYVDMKNINKLNQISKDISCVLTSNDPYWEKNTSDLLNNPCKKIKYANPGVTCLLLQATRKNHLCIGCNSRRGSIHQFYGAPVCEKCTTIHPTFMIGRISKLCTKYFMDIGDTEGIEKMKYSNSFNVLESDILKLAEKKYPSGLLKEKIFMREMKAKLVKKKGLQTRMHRIREISYGYEEKAMEMSVRIDKELWKYDEIHTIVCDNQLYGLYGDSMDVKIRTNDSHSNVVERLTDLACIVTFMKKKSLLTEDYDTVYDDLHTIKGIYMKYKNTGVHFYEIICQYMESRDSFNKRLVKMTEYLGANTIYSDRRHELSVNCCVEEGVDYDSDIFSDFVTFGIGNPVRQARVKRQQVFMNQHRYMIYVSDYMNYYHIEREDAERNARGKVLSVTNGFPPMMNVCNVDY